MPWRLVHSAAVREGLSPPSVPRILVRLPRQLAGLCGYGDAMTGRARKKPPYRTPRRYPRCR